MKQLNFVRAVGTAVVFAIILLGMITRAEAHAGNSSVDVIHACVDNKSGVTRIVGVNGACTSRESALHWAIVGPTGATGPAGPIGPAGPTPILYSLGDIGPAGGIVFHVTNGGLHGLEAAPEDQSSNAPWGCYGTLITGADGTAFGTGAQNTADILAGCSEANIAASIAHDYSLNGYNDWFLPSIDELIFLYQQKAVVGGFAGSSDYYWSSSEFDGNYAWDQRFLSGLPAFDNKGDPHRVRTVRAF